MGEVTGVITDPWATPGLWLAQYKEGNLCGLLKKFKSMLFTNIPVLTRNAAGCWVMIMNNHKKLLQIRKYCLGRPPTPPRYGK